MAAPNSSWSELLTTALYNRRGKAADQITDSMAGFMAIKEAGAVDSFDGGISLVEEIEYAENPNHKWYSGYEELPIAPHEHLSAYEFPIKQASIAMTISGLEQIQNSGKNQMIKLISSRIRNMEKTAKNKHNIAFYGDGTADGGKQMGGLGLLLPDNPATGTVGGISRVDNTFARHQVLDASTETGSAVNVTNIRSLLGTLMVRCSRENDGPKIGILGEEFWTYLHDSAMAIQQIVDDKSSYAKAGYQVLKFRQRPMVLDAGFGAACPSRVAFLLNPKYIKYRPFSQRDWVVLDPGERHSINQDALVKIMAWAGNMTMSCAFLQGKLID